MIIIWYSIILCENKYSTFLFKNKTTTKEELTTLEVVRRNPGGGRIKEEDNAPLVPLCAGISLDHSIAGD